MQTCLIIKFVFDGIQVIFVKDFVTMRILTDKFQRHSCLKVSEIMNSCIIGKYYSVRLRYFRIRNQIL
jgi:hypothetical protein